MKGVGADHPYWEALRDGRVSQQQCSDCQQWHWPAVYRCSHCGSWEQQWHEVEPRGRIYSWTRSHYDFGGPREHGLPSVSVLVELEHASKTRLLGTLEGNPAQLRIGDQVSGQVMHVEFDGESLPTLRWQLTDQGEH